MKDQDNLDEIVISSENYFIFLQILEKVLKTECDRVLFSKEELRDHFDYISKKTILMKYNVFLLKQQFD